MFGGLKPSICLTEFIKFLQKVTQFVFSEALLDKDPICLVSAVPQEGCFLFRSRHVLRPHTEPLLRCWPLLGDTTRIQKIWLSFSPFLIALFIRSLIYGYAGSSLLHTGFLWLWRASFSQNQHLSLRGPGSRACRLQKWWHTGSAFAVNGTSCPKADRILPDQEWNPCPLHGQGILNHWTTSEVLIALAMSHLEHM